MQEFLAVRGVGFVGLVGAEEVPDRLVGAGGLVGVDGDGDGLRGLCCCGKASESAEERSRKTKLCFRDSTRSGPGHSGSELYDFSSLEQVRS